MNTNRERSVAGDFRADEKGAGVWALTSAADGGVEIHIGGVDPGAAQALRGAHFSAVSVTWRSDGVSLVLDAAAGQLPLHSRSSVIHEPLPALYAGLPLAVLDDRARRFWRRVFWLVRIPGLVARRTGGGARPG
jgi:hypothetical protein